MNPPRSFSVFRLLATILACCQSVSLAGEPDVVIFGATPGGIATAVRAAREGLSVTLIHHHRHIGGMMVNGLGVLDTSYDGYRAPFFDDEVKGKILSHYRDRYAPGSEEYRKYEPHVAERLFENLITAEKNITLLREWYPVSAVRDGRILKSVTFKHMDGTETKTIRAASYVDASYEGDLAKITGTQLAVGRESRQQYGEPHAGHIFTKMRPVQDPAIYRKEGLNLTMFAVEANEPLPGSTGAGDGAIQAYNFRVCWTRDAANQIPVQKPARYERDIFLELESRWKFTNRVPNSKTSWNAPLLIGGNHDYPVADWPTRRAIAERHRDLAIGLLWFLQHDDIVPEKTRREALQWGLPKDEFLDNGGFPWEMYVREARRLIGRKVFTQLDGMAAPGLKRSPIQLDSIAITEWPLDSHACTLDSVEGSDHEGKVLLAAETRPGQISYQCLLPKDLDNLLVTVCLSSSHIGWGTVRLEPVWMHVGESAGYALALARDQGVPPAAVPPITLRRKLVEKRVMVGFFNDFDTSAPTPAQRAAQYYSTLGFFPTYDARLDAPLTHAVAAVWARPDVDPMVNAKRLAEAEKTDSQPISARDFAKLAKRSWSDAPDASLTRGAACVWLYANP